MRLTDRDVVRHELVARMVHASSSRERAERDRSEPGPYDRYFSPPVPAGRGLPWWKSACGAPGTGLGAWHQALGLNWHGWEVGITLADTANQQHYNRDYRRDG